MRSRATARWAIWAVSLGLLCAVALVRVDPAAPIQTNILTLLPEQHDSPALDAATARSRDTFSGQLLALVRGPNKAGTRQAAQAARQALLAAGLVDGNPGTRMDQALALYRQHHFALLTPDQVRQLDAGGPKALAMAVAVALASPTGMVSLGHDPGGYLARFITDLPRPYPDFLPDGPMLSAVRGDQRVFLLRMQVSRAAYGSDGQKQAAAAVKAARQAVIQTCLGCSFQATGAALFANAARIEAQHETVWLTLVSMLLIMLLIGYVFRSLAPHLLGFLQLGASVAAATAAVMIVFGSISILTLVFGTTLLGIAIDYAFLYFAEYWFGSSRPERVMGKIRGGLGVGLLTGVLAFAFLAMTGFPALSQIAVFSAAGLIEAALVVVLIFPVTLRRPPTVAAFAALDWPWRFMRRASRPSRWRWLLPLLVLALAAPGWWQLRASDDVRELSHFPPQLLQTDHDIRATLGRFPASGFYLIEGADLEQALMRESRLFARLQNQLPDADALGLSRFVPARAQQQASLATWRQLLGSPADLRQAFVATGLPPALADHVAKGWQSAAHETLAPSALTAAVPDLKKFIIRSEDGVALLGSVFGHKDLDNAVLAKAASGLEGVRYIQPLQRIDAAFASIRVRATWLVVLGYFLISALLVWRYGWREAVRMVLPPLLALGITLGALGWLAVPMNVFVVVALILILGLGRDYAVFLREVGARARSPALSVTLSAITTLLSFGLLALSRIPALHAFGLAVGIGILASYLLTPLSLPPEREDAP